ncbi:hypothetical protein m4_igs_338 [Acanthamoeba polyphaga mimivirus]|nr:hypothetical protein m4_igs_338 [Acanthamoeba polyphaga mimivirus]
MFSKFILIFVSHKIVQSDKKKFNFLPIKKYNKN